MWEFESFPGYYVFNGLLFVLQGLHIFWFYLISKMAVGLFMGTEIADTRSDSESDGEENEKEK